MGQARPTCAIGFVSALTSTSQVFADTNSRAEICVGTYGDITGFF
jgi:hypothetical protein